MKNLIYRAFVAKKKLFTLFLALAASAGTVFAWDYEKVKIGDLYYNLNSSSQTAAVTADWNDPYSGDIVIPDSITYNTMKYYVTSIGDTVFQNPQITSVIIPNSVTSIGRVAFSGCSGLTSIDIPNSVTSIGDGAFAYCEGLTSIDIPNSVTSIGDGAFAYCEGLTSVMIGNSVTYIGDDAFHGCTGLTSVTIPNSVTSIGNEAFSDCSSLTSPVYNAHVFAYLPTSYSGAYTIPDGIESIAGGAFSGCTGLTSITIPNSVTSIGEYAFDDCFGLKSVTIPNSVTSIGWSAFSHCTGLTSVTIPNSVTSIGDYAFQGCNSLTSVTIPNSVTSIGYGAFAYCEGLTVITCMATTPPALPSTNVFGGLEGTITLYVPQQSIDEYMHSSGWASFESILSISAEETNCDTVKAEPTYNSVEVTWPVVSGAYSYELVIRDKDGNVVCTLVFNEHGELLSIAFHAPGRNVPQQTQSTGFAFTITGLEEGTSYDATIIAKDGEDNTLDTSVVSFTTKGDTPTGINQITNDQSQMTNKILRDGQIFILRGEKTYTLTGQEVR